MSLSPRKRSPSKNSNRVFLEIDLNDISVYNSCPHLSDGVFYNVYEGTWNEQDVYLFFMDGTSKFRKRLVPDPQVERMYDRFPEISILKQLPNHYSITNCIGICYPEPDIVVLVVEKFGHMTLQEYILNEDHIDAKKILSIGRKIVRSLSFLHKHGIIHCDIGLCNFLIDIDTMDIKLYKFTLARHINDSTCPPLLGPVRSMAPEQVIDNNFSVASDIWQLGILFYELVTKSTPYENLDQEEVYEILKHRLCKIHPPRLCPPLLSRLIVSCTNLDPNKRPNLKSILNILKIPKLNKK